MILQPSTSTMVVYVHNVHSVAVNKFPVVVVISYANVSCVFVYAYNEGVFWFINRFSLILSIISMITCMYSSINLCVIAHWYTEKHVNVWLGIESKDDLKKRRVKIPSRVLCDGIKQTESSHSPIV